MENTCSDSIISDLPNECTHIDLPKQKYYYSPTSKFVFNELDKINGTLIFTSTR